MNLSSTAAEFAARGQVNYAASKGGIDGLTRAMAKELAPRNVRVNAVAPGMIETDMSQVVRGMAGDQIKKIIPLKRIGQPEEIARVVAFLASDEAAYMTGQVLRVDGGLEFGRILNVVGHAECAVKSRTAHVHVPATIGGLSSHANEGRNLREDHRPPWSTPWASMRTK